MANLFLELRDSIFDIDPKDPLKVTVKPMFLQFEEIRSFLRSKRVIKGDADGREKSRHYMELAWIFHMVSGKSPYCKYAPDTRKNQVTKAIFGSESDWVPDDVVIKLMGLYKEITETPMMRLLAACYANLDNAGAYFESVDYNKLDASGKSVWTTENVFKSMERLGKLNDSLKLLKEQVQKEEEGDNGDIRRGVVMTPFNQGEKVDDLTEY